MNKRFLLSVGLIFLVFLGAKAQMDSTFENKKDSLMRALIDTSDKVYKWHPINKASVRLSKDQKFQSGEVQDTTKGKIVVDKSLDIFFAQEMAYFLSGTSDLSLQKNYAVLNKDNGRLLLGKNWGATKKGEITHFILTAGVETKLQKGISDYLKKDEFRDELGFRGKLTYYGNGWTNFDTIQKVTVRKKRESIIKEVYVDYIMQEYQKELINRKYEIDTTKNIDSVIYHKALEKVYEKEAAALQKSREFNSIGIWWVSGQVFTPFWIAEYESIDSTFSNTTKSSSYLFNGEVSANLLWEKKVCKSFGFRIVGNAFTKVQNFNNIQSGKIKEITVDKYKEIALSNDTSTVTKTESNKYYNGTFEDFYVMQWGFQITVYPIINRPSGKKNIDWVGFNFKYSNYFMNDGDYSPETFTYGIPFAFKDKDGKVKVNFEPQWVRQEGVNLLGVNVGLPFGSLIY